jgi:hypothetical protein
MEAVRFPRIRLDRQLLALVSLLLGLAVVGLLVTDERMSGMNAGPAPIWGRSGST